MAGKGEEQIAEGSVPNGAVAAQGDAAAKLSHESNQIGMTGFVGGVERVALTTLDGAAHIPKGLVDAAVYDYHHPSQIAKAVLGSAAIAAVMKTVLPEAGPVGQFAGAAMGIWFAVGSAPAFYGAYKTGLNANTWAELNHGGAQWGDAAGQLGVNSALGYVGYKIGAGFSGRVLSSERFDAFADWKQNKWNSISDITKGLLRMDTTVPTATSVSLQPNYVIQGQRATLIDSAEKPPAADVVSSVDPEAAMNATVYLQPKASPLLMDRYIARMADGRDAALNDVGGAYEQKFGASQESLTALSDFAKQNNLSVAESDLRSGRVYLTGKTADFQKAFGVELNNYSADVGLSAVGHGGDISLPKELAPHVRSVLGMSTQPAPKSNYVVQVLDDPAHPQLEPGMEGPILPEDYLKEGGYLATYIAKAQNFPLATGGEGQHGAFISLDGGLDLADYNQFFADHGLPQPKPLKIIEVGGAKNEWGKSGADVENALDGLQMQSVAPNAEITMILGKNNQGLADTFERAIFPKGDEAQNTVVSASWGLAEHKQPDMLINTLHVTFKQAALRGVQIFSGSGDNGARSQSPTYQPEYPAADPNVTGVGGLKMILDNNGKIAWVKAWEEKYGSTGGGVSKIFDLPDWQKTVGVPNNLDTGKVGRGVPDIATNAASSTGYAVRVGGKNLVIGGTSAGAPLYAGLMLNINAELAPLGIKPITPLNPWMYARATDPNIFHDVTKGGNYGYQTRPGWDPVTGLGWVDGTAMLNAMKASQTTAVPQFSLLPQGLNLQGSVGTDGQKSGQ